MSVLVPLGDGERLSDNPVERAVDLLSQQVWCWGRDVLRPEGNYLLEIGFQRTAPPAKRENHSSVYTLWLCRARCVVLRGFGVFFGDSQRGGVFLPRYEFRPRYTSQAALMRPPWSNRDLPRLHPPTAPYRATCVSLTLDLLDWIRSYEVLVAEELGVEYRRDTLRKWDDGEKKCIPAEQMPSAWRALSLQVAANSSKFL